MIPIGIGPHVSDSELQELSMGEKEHVFHVDSADQLTSILPDVVNKPYPNKEPPTTGLLHTYLLNFAVLE